MAKLKISDYSSTSAGANLNTDINTIDIDEGCAPSGINNAIRTLMAQIKDFQTGVSGDGLTLGGALSGTSATLSGDLTVDTNTLYVDSTNNRVGIGTSSPSRSLHVIGNTLTEASGTSLIALAMKNTNGGTNEKAIDFLNNGNAFSLRILDDTLAAANTAYYVSRNGYTPTAHRWYTAASGSSSERMRIDSSGNVGIGTSSPSSKLDVVGNIEVSGGIYLGGTASANLLDDYEEGTWTPTLVARIGSSPTVTYTNQIGLYRKIGSLVFIDIRLVISAYTGNGASQVAIGGLPFTKSILSSETGGVTFGYANGASVFTTPAGFIREGATLISLFDQPSGSSYLVDADFAASGTQGFFVTACYTTDS